MAKVFIVLISAVLCFSLYKSIKGLVGDIRKIKVRKKVIDIMFTDEVTQNEKTEE